MSNAKHIPGPWRVFNHSWSDSSILADGFDHAVCLLDINYATEESQEADEAVMAANARLIAAAPELLSALEFALVHMNSESRAAFVIKAAIAKATGEQP